MQALGLALCCALFTAIWATPSPASQVGGLAGHKGSIAVPESEPVPEPSLELAPQPIPSDDAESSEPEQEYRISVPDEELDRDLLGPGQPSP